MPTIKAKLINRDTGDKVIATKVYKKNKFHPKNWVCVNIKVNNKEKAKAM